MRYASLDQIRRRSKAVFGAQYRLEALLAATSFDDDWTRTELVERVAEIAAAEDDQRPMAASSLHKEIEAMAKMFVVEPAGTRDPLSTELQYRTIGGAWVAGLAAELRLDLLATVTDLPATGSA